MILVDTTVWIDHFRSPEPSLQQHLAAGQVLTHSMVIGELACGNLPRRKDTLQRLASLSRIVELDHGEVLQQIEGRSLMGRGIGFVDTHLICSVLNRRGASLWTRDRRLKNIADELGVGFAEQARE